MRKEGVLLATAAALAISAGTLQAQLPPTVNQHLMGYRVGVNTKATPPGVKLPKGTLRSFVDQFGASTSCEIKGENILYVPASKNGSSILDPAKHYLSYQVRCPAVAAGIGVHSYFDQFHPTGAVMTPRKVNALLVPTRKVILPGADPANYAVTENNYLCWQAKGPKFGVKPTVTTSDQFNSLSLSVTGVDSVCNPVNKNGEDPTAPTNPDHYVCYKTKPAVKPPKLTVSLRTNNLNFGPQSLSERGTSLLCVPAFKDNLPPPQCCPQERITLTSSSGVFTCDGLPGFPAPAGTQVVLDVGEPHDGTCDHPLTVAALTVPTFPIPGLNYCSRITTLGCESGSGGKVGAGELRDGNGPVGAPTNVLVTADSRDGVCDTTSGSCAGVAGMNNLGDVDVIRSPSAGSGMRIAAAARVRSLTWIEQGCVSGTDPNCTGGNPSLCCCRTSTFGDEPGDLKVTESDAVVWATTNVATAAYVDKNGDGCSMDGSGPAGPTTLTGAPAPGPCCQVGQATTFVGVNVALLSGGAPMFDMTYTFTAPMTVSSCGAYVDGSCTVSSNPCDL